ncbi:MAG: ribosome-associated translation inhibitor RaiA [Acidobacteriota bacterium]
MKLDFTARAYHLHDDVRGFANQKLTKVERFVDAPAEAHLVLESVKHRQIADLVVHHRHGTLQATEEADDMRDAIHAVTDKVEKQARRSRKRFMDRRRRAQRQTEIEAHWPIEVLDRETVSAEAKPVVVKTRRLPIEAMSIERATERLDSSKNDFWVFLDRATEKVSVLYRRKDDHLGLITPEI